MHASLAVANTHKRGSNAALQLRLSLYPYLSAKRRIHPTNVNHRNPLKFDGIMSSFTVRATKSPEAKWGLVVQEINGRIFVKQIDSQSSLRGTKLKIGHELISINGIACSQMAAQDTGAILRGANQDLTVEAMEHKKDTYAVVVIKDAPTASVGLRVEESNGRIVVKSMSETIPFLATRLKLGDHIVCINRVPCEQMTAQTAANIMKAAQSSLELIVKEVLPCIFTISVEKEQGNSPVGLGIKEVNGQLYVSKVSNTSPFHDTRLQIGVKILSINDVPCDGMTYKTATDIIKAAEKQVCISATESTMPSVPVATATKTPVAVAPVAVTPATGQDSVVPPGLPAGGVWGISKYYGSKSKGCTVTCCVVGLFFLPACICAMCPFLRPLDERELYKVGGKFYTADGKLVGSRETIRGFQKI